MIQYSRDAGDRPIGRSVLDTRLRGYDDRRERRASMSAPFARSRAFGGLCDDEGMPVICPTCQVVAQSVSAQSASVPATAGYFAWGCFRYFRLGAALALAHDPLLQGMQLNPGRE